MCLGVLGSAWVCLGVHGRANFVLGRACALECAWVCLRVLAKKPNIFFVLRSDVYECEIFNLLRVEVYDNVRVAPNLSRKHVDFFGG